MNVAHDGIWEALSRRFRPYAAYNDSGFDWLGDLPAHWRVIRLKFIAQIVAGQSPPSTAVTEDVDGLPFLQGNAEFGSLNPMPRQSCDSAPKSAKSGDILLSVRAPVGAMNIADQAYGIGRGLCAIQPSPGIGRAFCFHEIMAMRPLLAAVSTGSTYDAVTASDVGDLPILLAPPDEQNAIAEFLDRETAKIDRLVARKERLIELLQEKRTALITRAVTRGLDANVSMEDSGTAWLGAVPAHWRLKRLWHLTPRDRRIMYGIVLPGPNVDVGVPIIKGGDVGAARLALGTLSKTSFEIESRYIRSRLRGGDLVYSIRGSIGDVARVPDELEGANLTQDAARIAYTAAIDGRWLLYALRSRIVFCQLEAGALGATIKGINIRDLKRALIPVPPKSEQVAIADFLDIEAKKTDRLLVKARQAVDLLKEFRTALISAAVTGKIDVREAVPQ